MKILLSINYKIFDESPDTLIKKIDGIKEISGFEVHIDMNNGYERDYLRRLAHLCNEKDLILQIHSSITEDDEIIPHIDYYHEIETIYNKPINMVNHPLGSDNIYLAQEKTNILFSKILNYIYEHCYRINVSIENLNSMRGIMRLSKDYLIPILSNNQDLFFTYDIGHEIMEYGKLVDLNDLFIERIVNVHIHTFEAEEEHLPIKEDSPNKLMWVKAINYLRQIGYDGAITLEYDMNKIGNNFDEKIDGFIEEAKFMYQYIGG